MLVLAPAARRCLTDVLIHHWATPTSGCSCGWSVLGASWAEHIADVYETALYEALRDT